MQVSTLDRWRHELVAQGYAQQTVAAKLLAVRLAAAHIDSDPLELTRADVLDWVGSHPEWAPWTRLKYLSHVRAFCAWAGIDDATADVRRPRQPAGIPRPVTEDVLTALLAHARPGRERAWVILGSFVGLRAHESAKVSVQDVISPAGEPMLHIVGKGGQVAIVPLPPIAVEVLREAARHAAPNGRLWPRATTKSVQESIRRIARRAGVECTSHQLRHRYGTQVQRTHRDLRMTQRLMRHASPATTAGYALVADDEASAVVSALPGAHGAAQAMGEGERPRLRLVR